MSKIRGQAPQVQTILAAIDPQLRAPLLDRLMVRGDIAEAQRAMLGIIKRSVLTEGTTGRRAQRMAQLKGVLVDGAHPDDRSGPIAALISASDALPVFHRDIPWKAPVITRVRELERGE